MRRSLALLLWLLPCVALPMGGTTVYKCTGSDGKVTFQDSPCGKAQRQQTLDLPDVATQPTPVAAASPPSATMDRADAAPTPPPSEPAAPLPRMYACIRATDGKAYLSGHGYPEPYLAPFGMLGAVQMPLAQAYGPSGGAGISAPEVNRSKITPGLVAGNYVWVQDQCRPLTAQETCHALQDAYDENARKLRRAFKSDRPPLEQRDNELRAQLGNC
ncbi:protein of unknown function [Dyella sp. OK004]|uniref:DUF4124 domain-containing protein n=1 Tax=Dyella sp. OK004 TaxID=1855292 RepID=UPI0008E3CCB1|nr:DUF4124 domain-containing protein [Dyella sp. OK004]SFR92378.1 protein of unknown function [Dyella sp. OK004]